jgi:hypothetical protein
MKKIIFICLSLSVTAFAEPNSISCEKKEEKTTCMVERAKEIVKKSVPKNVKQKLQEISVSESRSDNQSQSSTINSPIIIINGETDRKKEDVAAPVCPPAEPRVHTIVQTEYRTIKVRQEKKKNLISILGGVGPTGSHAKTDGQEVHLTTDHSFVFGAQIQRRVSDQSLIGITVLSNSTGLLNLGWEY